MILFDAFLTLLALCGQKYADTWTHFKTKGLIIIIMKPSLHMTHIMGTSINLCSL